MYEETVTFCFHRCSDCFFGRANQGYYYYNDEINSDTPVEEYVRRIGNGAFLGCSNMSSINFFGDSLVSIGDSAFYGLNMYSFNIELPSTFDSLGAYAFAGCSYLRKCNLENASYIGSYAFSECWSLDTGDYWRQSCLYR